MVRTQVFIKLIFFTSLLFFIISCDGRIEGNADFSDGQFSVNVSNNLYEGQWRAVDNNSRLYFGDSNDGRGTYLSVNGDTGKRNRGEYEILETHSSDDPLSFRSYSYRGVIYLDSGRLPFEMLVSTRNFERNGARIAYDFRPYNGKVSPYFRMEYVGSSRP